MKYNVNINYKGKIYAPGEEVPIKGKSLANEIMDSEEVPEEEVPEEEVPGEEVSEKAKSTKKVTV